MPNTQNQFQGRKVVISENTTNGTYQIDVYASGASITGTVQVTYNFTDAQFLQYKAQLLKMLSMPA